MGYKELTPSGNKSTAYDYTKRVEKICKDENISIASKKTISSKIPLIIAGIFTIGALGVLKVLKKV